MSDTERDELVRTMVMNTIADDYEATAMIVDEVIGWARERGMEVAPEDVCTALVALVDSGAAKAYRLSGFEPPFEVQSLPQVDFKTDLYFLLTPVGRGLIKDY